MKINHVWIQQIGLFLKIDRHTAENAQSAKYFKTFLHSTDLYLRSFADKQEYNLDFLILLFSTF